MRRQLITSLLCIGMLSIPPGCLDGEPEIEPANEEYFHEITGVITHSNKKFCGCSALVDISHEGEPPPPPGGLPGKGERDLEITAFQKFTDNLEQSVTATLEATVMGLKTKSTGKIGVTVKGEGCIEVASGDPRTSIFKDKPSKPFISDAKVTWEYALSSVWGNTITIGAGVEVESLPLFLFKTKASVEGEVKHEQSSEVGLKVKSKEVKISEIEAHFRRADIYFEDVKLYVRHKLEEDKARIQSELQNTFINNAFTWKYQHIYDYQRYDGLLSQTRKNEEGTKVYDGAWCWARRYVWEQTHGFLRGEYRLVQKGDVVLYDMPVKDPLVREYQHGIGTWTKYEFYGCSRVEMDAATVKSNYNFVRGYTLRGKAIREFREGRWFPVTGNVPQNLIGT